MGIRTLIWSGFFFGMCVIAFVNPIWGIVGYMGTYTVGPSRQWWAAPINALGIRYSFTMSACIVLAMALHWNSLRPRFGRYPIYNHEKLILLYLLIAWLGTWFTPDTVGRYTVVDHPSVKLTKVVVFTFMLSHIATDLQRLNKVIWILVVGVLVIGIHAYETPPRGRLNTIGGPDFAESNTLTAFLGANLVLIGIQLYRSPPFGKVVCLVAGVLGTNAIVLTRSRGGFLGLAVASCVAVALVPKKHRAKVLLGVIIAGAGSYYLMDPQFKSRMTTIASSGEERDTSTISRLEIWQGGTKIFLDNPLGVGFGNWYQVAPKYIPRHGGMDAHNTYVKVACELGLQGIVLFLLIVGHAFVVLWRIRKRAKNLPNPLADDFTQLSFAFTLSLSALLTCCITMSLSRMEALWWFLMLPVCLERCLDDAENDLLADAALDDSEPAFAERS